MKKHRHSIRLPNYDYSQVGAYFVTICANDRNVILGDLIDGCIILNECGIAIRDSWQWLSVQYDYVELDMFVVMPNHIHGIIVIRDFERKGGSRAAPTSAAQAQKRKPLGELIGAFKTFSTKQINQLCNTPGVQFWQRNYYEHVIRNERELQCVREYIDINPIRWEYDRENPITKLK